MLRNFGVTTAYNDYAGIPSHPGFLQLPLLYEKIGQCAISSIRMFFDGIVALSPLYFFCSICLSIEVELGRPLFLLIPFSFLI